MNSDQATVLIVDDREANRYTTAHALTRSGFKVIEAATGREGLELSKSQPAVIILDVKLPDIVGYEVCRRIKANANTKHIPILQLSSAFLSNESKLYALESGADAYLIQPADPVVLVATVRSLVRLHHAESKAQSAATQWQATFDALSEGVAIVDSSGTITRCNRAMTELTGKAFGEIESGNFNDLIQSCFGIEIPKQSDALPIEVKSGNRFFRLSLDPIRMHEEPTDCVFVVAETTKQKLAEQALLVSERLVATGRMANTIAHEINNPLEAITNLIYLLQNPTLENDAAHKLIDTAAREVARVSRIARQILSFNRESSTKVKISICEIIDDVIALNKQAMSDRELDLDRDWEGDWVIYGFPAQLRQVFSNLLRNAIEASLESGKIRIRISATRLGSQLQTSAVRITISDRGTGIPRENRARIFEAFFTTKDLKGSGIGLWLSSSIIHEHGGYIRVRSSTTMPHTGSCISVVLPGYREEMS